jgi:hypothetical protein
MGGTPNSHRLYKTLWTIFGLHFNSVELFINSYLEDTIISEGLQMLT